MAQLQMLYSEWLDQDLVGWIQINLLPQYWHHHIETRQIQFIVDKLKNDKMELVNGET